MSVLLTPEDEIRAALRPYRASPAAFEAGVRERLQAAARDRDDAPLQRLSPWLQGAAALLPIEAIVGAKARVAAGQLAAGAGIFKPLGFLVFPAVSFFVLLGTTIFSIAGIHSARRPDGLATGDEQALREAVDQWWKQHKLGATVVFTVTVVLSLLGATWALFILYIVSFGLLVYVVTSLANLGLGNRQVIGQSCLAGLMLLGQLASFSWIAFEEIQVVDSSVLGAMFFGGALLLLPFVGGRPSPKALSVAIIVPLIAWLLSPVLWPATPQRIKSYVESFHDAPNEVSWQHWEIVGRWAIEAKLDPDLSGARRLLAHEIAGPQNPFVLSSAFRLGLVRPDQLPLLRDLANRRQGLLEGPRDLVATQRITSLDQHDWVIRALLLGNNLSNAERDLLAARLHASLDSLSASPYEVLNTARLATQLLAAIDRPVNPAQYRVRIHDWLRKSHTTHGGGFEPGGGFKTYLNLSVGSLPATSDAVALMEIYGVPEHLNLNWVRSYLRPQPLRIGNQKWIAAVTRDRLNRLPGAKPLSAFEVLYYERSLVAAAVLVGLCLYATLSSPIPREGGASDRRPHAGSLPDNGPL